MRVKGPNGLVLTVADEIGKSLVGSRSGEYVEVKGEAKASPRVTASKPSRKPA